MEMASVDKEKYTKRREKLCIIKKAALIKQAQWTQIFSTEKKNKKRRAKYVSNTKEKKERRKRVIISKV